MTVFNWIIASPCRGVRSVEKEIYNDAGGDNDEEEFLVASHFESQNVHGIEQPETERKQNLKQDSDTHNILRRKFSQYRHAVQ